MSHYAIKTHKSVDKFLSSHPEIARHFIEKFSLIAQNPKATLVDTKPLKGKPNNYRLRIGKYRFLYEIKNKEILIRIWRADSRGSAYNDM